MKTVARAIIFCLILWTLIVFPAIAQAISVPSTPGESAATPGQTCIENIQLVSDGNIEIYIDNKIIDLIFSEPSTQSTGTRKATKKVEKQVNKGYRVQVFGEAGNQATLASRCRARGSMVLAKFPKYRGQLYIFSKSPNWYCRVGNFKTSAEAAKAAAEIRRAFPQFAGEVRTVQSTIVPK